MRVLVVEDQPNVAAYVGKALEEHGYAVDQAATGGEALYCASVVAYDLIILDIMLPEVDGLTVCRRLRGQGHEAAVLMLTARNSVDDRVAGLDVGADDYLVKPFELKELLARVRALARRGPTRSTALRVADLTLDTRAHLVRRGETAIKLTAKEYAVLECLMREPGRVLTRSEIADAVWNYDSDNQSNVVDVYIRNLRRKLDDGFEPRLIHTVRGAGYCLSDQHGDEQDS